MRMEAELAYSTNIQNNRYSVPCLTVTANCKAVRLFVVDTGAKYTCCNYRAIDETLQEDDIKSRNGCKCKLLGGLIEGDREPAEFYKYTLQQFTIGNIDMKSQDVWITFDPRVNEKILGMDILRYVLALIYPEEDKIYFFENKDECIKLLTPGLL